MLKQKKWIEIHTEVVVFAIVGLLESSHEEFFTAGKSVLKHQTFLNDVAHNLKFS